MARADRRAWVVLSAAWLLALTAAPIDAQQQFRNNRFRNNGNNAGRPQLRIPDNVVVERDIEYGRAGERSLKLDLVRPKDAGDKPLPVVAYVHGGAWRMGSKEAGLNPLANLVTTGNYIGVSIGYRLSEEAAWPAQIHDCKAAIRWLRANAAKYHFDPERIGAWGGSAGGHLVSLLGTSGDVSALEGNNGAPDVSSRVQCVVDFCGTSDIAYLIEQAPERVDRNEALTLLFGGKPTEKREAAAEASPIRYITADDPPFLVAHGTKDPVVPFSQAERFVDALEKAKIDVTFIRMEGGGHGVFGPEINARVRAFFDKHLRGQSVEVSDQPIPVAAK